MSILTKILSRLSKPEPPAGPPNFAHLSEIPDPTLIPLLDRPGIDESALTQDQCDWRREGMVIKLNGRNLR